MTRKWWRHKTRVFKTESGWTWTCYHAYCPNFSVHKDHAAILKRALNHTFLGGYHL